LGERETAIEEGGADLEDLRDLFSYTVIEGVTFGNYFKNQLFSHHMGVQKAFALSLGKVVEVT
jgi:hypothetical protein